MEKPGKKKKKGKTRQDLDGRIHRLAGSIGQGGRVLFGVRTRDQEFASKSINLGSFSLVCIRFQSSYDLCQPTFSFSPFSPTSIPDTVIFRLLPVTRYTPPPSVFFPILCIVTCILSLSVTDFLSALPLLLPDPASTRIIERLPFRDTYGVILLGNRRILCFSRGTRGKFFYDFFIRGIFKFVYGNLEGFFFNLEIDTLKRINWEIFK